MTPRPLLRVLSTGVGLSLQGPPRLCYRRYGVSPAGPLDAPSLADANRLLLNPPDGLGLEILLGPCSLEVLADTWLAHAGSLACAPLPSPQAAFFPAGTILRFGYQGLGNLSYLVASGGFAAEAVFGSPSTHAPSCLGPQIQEKTELMGFPDPDLFSASILRRTLPASTSSPSLLRLSPGPHLSILPDPAALTAHPFTISPRSSRAGFRLSEKVPPREKCSLPSFPVVPGCIQLTPDGTLIVCLPDGPTVGGYPVVAILHPDDLPAFCQTPLGHPFSFTFDDDASPQR